MSDIQTTLETASKKLAVTSDSATLDAEVLLCHVLKKSRSHLRAWPEKELPTTLYLHFMALLEKRQQGIPIAYLTGHREFWSRQFKVNPDVLIPRPDTELLIELSLQLLKDKLNARIIDLGTGSGIIAITLAAERPDLEVIAIDYCNKALNTAKKNAITHQTKTIQFIQSDWLTNVPHTAFDLLISNPPYIASDDPHLFQGDVRFEPESALIAKDQGLKDIKTITTHAGNYLKQNGTLLLEHGFDQQASVQAILDTCNYKNIATHTDLSGNPRVTSGQWNP